VITPLAPAERSALLAIARAAVRHHLGLGPGPEVPADGALTAERGAFVTLHLRGGLRGCIGSFRPLGSLARTVAAMAVSASSEDPRFPPVSAVEVEALTYHVAVLEPCHPMSDLSDVVIGRDGFLVRRGFHRGALLPVVAVERGWDAATFLKHACLKAGLPPDAWRDSGTTVEIFSAQEFGDEEPSRGP